MPSTAHANRTADALAKRAADSSIDFSVWPNAFGGWDLGAEDGSGWSLRIAQEDAGAPEVDLYVFNRSQVVQRSAHVVGAAPETVAAIALALWEDAAS